MQPIPIARSAGIRYSVNDDTEPAPKSLSLKKRKELKACPRCATSIKEWNSHCLKCRYPKW